MEPKAWRLRGSAKPMPTSPSLTPFPWMDVIIILLLVALNGVFAMS